MLPGGELLPYLLFMPPLFSINIGDEMSEKRDVVGLGNALMDALVLLPVDDFISEQGLTKGEMHMVDDLRWQEVYSNISGADVDLQTGGSCANTIATLGLLGASVSYCSQVGDDEFGKSYSQKMYEACGRQSLLVSKNCATGKCLSLISSDAERTMITDLGAAIQLPGVSHFEDEIRQSRLLYLTGYLMFGEMRNRMLEAIKIAKSAGVKVGLDVADPSVIQALRDEMLALIKEHVDIIFLNESEASALCGGTPKEAIDELKSHCEIVVVKLGSKGSMAYGHGKVVHAGIHRVKAVDTTGAGDSYAAGFLYGWAKQWDLQKCVELGSRVAAETVAQLGAVVRNQQILDSALSDVQN